MTFGPLVSTQWLASNLEQDDLKIVDGSWRMPGQGAAIEDYRNRHLPGAVFFDIDAIADQSSDLPHMLPKPAQFSRTVGAMGVSPDDKVVIYDDQGLFSAARVWWTFRAMGHANVAVMDGGLPKWLREGQPVTGEETICTKTSYRTRADKSICANADTVRAALGDQSTTIIDARPAARFRGETPEPREGLRSGHMPGAINVPFSALVGDGGVLRPPEMLRSIFEDAGVDLETRVISSCGSGVTAAVVSLALEELGCRHNAVYDGSWAEWGDETHDNTTFPVIGAVVAG